MGIFDKVKEAAMNQFIEVIEWLDDSNDTILYRFPVYQQEIKNGAQLIVRESQAAVFVFEGQVADTFGPGRYTIDGGNTPILSKLGAWKFGFNSPIKAEVYFVNTKQFTDLKWGTANPVMLRDNDFGIVRLRAFGAYSMRVVDPQTFIKEVAGTNSHFQTNIDGQLKRAIVSEFSDALGELKIPALDLAAQYKELGGAIRDKINEDFKTYGIEVTKFYVENISLPEEVEAAIDKRSSMGAVGDMNRYMQYQSAEAIRDAANNPSGGAGLGAGMGAGFALGNQMANAFGNQQGGQQSGTQSSSQTPTVACPSCGKQNAEGTKFCGDCGAKMQSAKVPCVKCGAELREGARFCSECGASQEKQKCANCQAELAPGAKFCPECGTKTEA